ncbi:MAG TPA: carboxypeptidase regulatory-like domain-containing protein [Terriglobia bacterium]|nr:carboxypeptidase regulatory-like domain-containing protein [Terriglobia bacterium]
MRVRSLYVVAALGAGLIVSIGLGNGPLFGQSFSAAISGIVHDTTGAVVPGVKITAKHTESGLTRTVNTNENGDYRMPSLPVGAYEVSAEILGFKQQVRRGINLSVAQEAVVNLTLEVGNIQDEVTVTGEAPLVNTTLASTAGLITGEQLKDLPLNGRSFHELMTLNTHTVDNRSNAGGASFSVAGKRTENNRWTINGMDYVGDNATGQYISPSGVSGQLLGVEAIREFNVLGHSYGAEYGKRSGGQVTAVTTSGTNKVHGTVFEYLRNSALDARNFFDEGVAPFKRNQFGASLGGPIIRDKMFAFGNYEGFRERLGVSSNEFVPSAQTRQGLLPCNVIHTTAAARAANCPDLNAYIPVPNLARGMLPYAQLFYPTPNGPEDRDANGLLTGVARATGNPVRRRDENFGLVRFDYNLSSADSLSANYTKDKGKEISPEANTLFRGTQTRDLYTLSVQETHIFSPTILNTAMFGASRASATDGSVPITPIPDNLAFLRDEKRKSPGAIVIGGGATAAQVSSLVSPNPQNPFYNKRQNYTASDDLRMTMGRHSLSMGVWFTRVQQTAFSSAQQNAGTVSYTTLLAFLQDQPTQFSFQASPTELNFRSTQAAFYLQDEIKLSARLTVRLGLRDEMTTGWNEKDGHAANYWFDQNGVIELNPHIGRSPFRKNYAKALLQPRVGVAWDPTGSGKWAVRSGFGIHNDLQDNLTHRLNANPPFAARVAIERTPLLSIIPVTGGAAKPTCSAQSSLREPDCSIFAPGGLDPDMHTPTIQEWSLEVERELAQNLAVELSYVGNQSYHVSTSMDMNTIRPVICQTPAGCLSGGVLPAARRATVPQGTEYIPVGTRPNPFVGSTQTWMYLGTAASHGVSASLTKRSTRGLTFRTNYTFSKVIDVDSAILAPSATNDPATILNPYNLKLNRGLASYNPLHQFSSSFSYALPFGSGRALGRGASGWVEKLIGDWQWNGIVSARSGFPITPTVGSNQSGNGDTRIPDVPNYNPNFKGNVILGVDEFKKTGLYFDPNAFSLPLTGTFGNVSRGAFRGPGAYNLDTSLFKRVALKETLSLQFRAEFFNILNHANFDTPNPIVFAGAGPNASAGKITETAGRERQIQFALKLLF